MDTLNPCNEFGGGSGTQPPNGSEPETPAADEKGMEREKEPIANVFPEPVTAAGDTILYQPGKAGQNQGNTGSHGSEQCVRRIEREEDTPEVKKLSNKEITDQTAMLWKYLPIPEDEPEPAPEYIVCDTTFPGARVVGARVRGKKHKHEGSNCDDWFEVAHYEDVTIIAVSDGAGSKKFSRIGARESCKAAAGFLAHEYPRLLTEIPSLREDLKLPLSDPGCVAVCTKLAEMVQNSVVQARKAVEAAFYSRTTAQAYEGVLQRKLQLTDLSGTLLVALIIPVRKETKEQLIVTCQIGDGMIAAFNSKGAFQTSVKLLAVPDSGEFTGETEFLTSPKMTRLEELQKRTKLSLGPIDYVLVMSDGVADDYFPNETQMRRLFFDLIVNGILMDENEAANLASLDKEQISLFKKIPDPIAYPWVNDKSVTVSVQYTSRILEATGITPEDLWKKQEILKLARQELKGQEKEETDGEKLCSWLDNYYERGSFDDRTLVIAEL